MQATIVDLRYHMNKVLKALDRNEKVEILYRGKRKGILVSCKDAARGNVLSHPFFNSRTPEHSVEADMDRLRGGRFRDL